MKQFLAIVCALFVGVASFAAQPEGASKPQFNAHWYLQLQGGVGHTVGEADFGKMLSPAMALNAGWQPSPVWGLRIGISGWEGKGAWFTPSQVYKFNFMQVNADVTVDLANWIGGFKYDRLVNPYVFLGVGGNFAFNNDQAKAIHDAGNKLSLLWTGSKAFVAGRAGVGVNFRLCDRMLLGLEVNTNMLPDKFNSKKAGNVDWQMNALAGLTFRLGKNYKKSAAPTPIPYHEPAPQPEVVEPEPVVLPVEQPAPVVEVEEPAQAPVETASVVTPVAPLRADAPAPPSPDSYKVRQDVFFTINSSVLQYTENEKIAALVECLKAYPKARVSVVGYADAPTGKPEGNYWLSGWRAIRVRDALKNKGISGARIDMNFVGDREQPYSDVVDNRVVICIVR